MTSTVVSLTARIHGKYNHFLLGQVSTCCRLHKQDRYGKYFTKSMKILSVHVCVTTSSDVCLGVIFSSPPFASKIKNFRVLSSKLIRPCLALILTEHLLGMSRRVFADLGKVVIALFIAAEILLQIFAQQARTNMTTDDVSLAFAKKLRKTEVERFKTWR